MYTSVMQDILVVGGDVTSAAGLVGQLSVLKGQLECAIKLTPLDAAPSGRLAKVPSAEDAHPPSEEA